MSGLLDKAPASRGFGRRFYRGDQNGRIFGPFRALTGPQSPVGFFECPDLTGAIPEDVEATLNSPLPSTPFYVLIC